MPWGAIAAAAISAGAGIYSSNRASRAARQQQRSADAQTQLAREQQDWSHGVYDEWHKTFGPLGERVAADAQREVNPDYDQIAADVHGQYAAQRGAEERRMGRYGISPMDGASGERDLRLGNAEATTHVLARNVARRGARQQKLQNMIAAYGMASGMPGLAANSLAASQAGLQGAGNIYGQQAAGYGADAAASFGAAGNIIGRTNWSTFNGGTGSGPSYQPSAGGSFSGWGSGGWGGQSGTGTANGFDYSSSREVKTGIAPADENDALGTVMDTPISNYRYKDGGPPMTGPIAEDAPPEISNGKQVNLINQVGTLTAAVQAIAKHLGIQQSSQPNGDVREAPVGRGGIAPAGRDGGRRRERPISPMSMGFGIRPALA